MGKLVGEVIERDVKGWKAKASIKTQSQSPTLHKTFDIKYLTSYIIHKKNRPRRFFYQVFIVTGCPVVSSTFHHNSLSRLIFFLSLTAIGMGR